VSASVHSQTTPVRDRRSGSDVKVFYREAGHKDAPAVLLLHGFPSSSHQYRGLIDRLSDKYRLIAQTSPDLGSLTRRMPTASGIPSIIWRKSSKASRTPSIWIAMRFTSSITAHQSASVSRYRGLTV